MVIVPRFYRIHRRSLYRSRQWSSRGQKLCENPFAPGSVPGPLPQSPSWLGGGSQPIPENPTQLRPFEPQLAICPILEKILRAPMPIVPRVSLETRATFIFMKLRQQ